MVEALNNRVYYEGYEVVSVGPAYLVFNTIPDNKIKESLDRVITCMRKKYPWIQ